MRVCKREESVLARRHPLCSGSSGGMLPVPVLECLVVSEQQEPSDILSLHRLCKGHHSNFVQRLQDKAVRLPKSAAALEVKS